MEEIKEYLLANGHIDTADAHEMGYKNIDMIRTADKMIDEGYVLDYKKFGSGKKAFFYFDLIGRMKI